MHNQPRVSRPTVPMHICTNTFGHSIGSSTTTISPARELKSSTYLVMHVYICIAQLAKMGATEMRPLIEWQPNGKEC